MIFNKHSNLIGKHSYLSASQHSWLNYDEDKLWIHRLIIRGFDKNGNDKKILRLKINDNLEYEYKIYDDAPKNEELET